ncbi:sensor histidine kinase [Bacillus sp. SA1-12]|uniref:sensor histidine kinase n=1 Tax=Bacillus sp. SA1-12 TaxID=1455638 RepID=UPI0012DFF5D9|nr:ATP-binding protein [Bacillus sp. SA1-12]
MYVTYASTRKTIELTIENQGISNARAVLNQFNVHTYEAYLKDENSPDKHQRLEENLRKAKHDMGTKEVYILKAAENNQPKLVADSISAAISMSNGGEYSNFLKELKREFTENQPFSIRVNDHKKRTYVLAGVPILNNSGECIGSLVIEEYAGTANNLVDNVIKSSFPFFLFSGLFVLFTFSIFLAYQLWLRRDVTSQVGDAEETYQGEYQSMLQTMRSIRHDFINHIQVIQGLLKLKREDMAYEYVNSLTKEVESMELPQKVNHPALYILLQSKWVRAQNDKVDMHLLVDEDSFHKMKSIDIIKILSNLIDNAFDATMMLPEAERFISIEVKAVPSLYFFKVENIGPRIPNEIKKEIFKVGFSTKEERKGVPRGDGLSIVKHVVERYGGTIEVDSNRNSTIFVITIPMKS